MLPQTSRHLRRPCGNPLVRVITLGTPNNLTCACKVSTSETLEPDRQPFSFEVAIVKRIHVPHPC